MAEELLGQSLTGMGLPGLGVRVDETLSVATLRYFARDGRFASTVRELTGIELPPAQRATMASDGELLLAWRSPTESWCVTESATWLAELERRLAAAADGCLLNLSGGVTVIRLSGARARDLLCRLGGSASMPAQGEARRSRLADVPVLAVGGVQAQVLLMVERVYAPHLLGWIRETLADLADA